MEEAKLDAKELMSRYEEAMAGCIAEGAATAECRGCSFSYIEGAPCSRCLSYMRGDNLRAEEKQVQCDQLLVEQL